MVLICLELIRKLGPGMNVFVVYGLTVMAGTIRGVALHLTVERPVVKFWQRVLGIERPVAKRSESLTSVPR